jgi:hypothetical protein
VGKGIKKKPLKYDEIVKDIKHNHFANVRSSLKISIIIAGHHHGLVLTD